MKKYFVLVSFFFNTLLVSAQCNGRYRSDIFSIIDSTTVQYGSNLNLDGTPINLMMDIYMPQGDTATSRPLVIIAHGGSFMGGSKTDLDVSYVAKELSKKGYVCASIDYRLATNISNLLVEKNTIETVFSAIQDGKSAVRFFKKDAATTNLYKINPNQIFFGGSSAGGILALNLAYIDSLNDLPESGTSLWQTWVTNIGGLEGTSGNSGYCSRVNGTFSFAAGIGDTSFIDRNDIPWYGSHAMNDQTVSFDCNFNSTVKICGSKPIESRLNNLGIYAHLDSYSGIDHPPYINSASILEHNKDSLANFLFNILDCNPNNIQLPNQKNCTNNNNVSIKSLLAHNISIKVYPNPFNDKFKIEISKNIENTYFAVINSLGATIIKQKMNTELNTIDLKNFPSGVYTILITNKKGSFAKKLIKKKL